MLEAWTKSSVIPSTTEIKHHKHSNGTQRRNREQPNCRVHPVHPLRVKRQRDSFQIPSIDRVAVPPFVVLASLCQIDWCLVRAYGSPQGFSRVSGAGPIWTVAYCEKNPVRGPRQFPQKCWTSELVAIKYGVKPGEAEHFLPRTRHQTCPG